ncbi:DUF742 domain-containing protein [Rhodococcus chondri]|uniref:DUF742 domain-containing protein n=1 Tax=Rhodococcus chondri TaxID=3065941 RepID=A0ABU7JVW3_9NOCA|nr:DUF742 domain-containing protein [Rhodococcus sp. CC-R104]MEE2033907.1 DUF742 domain-containing protein [Rhodococcus sp. CC-R104]
MSVADSEWPVVGATGARFGSGRARRRRHSAEAGNTSAGTASHASAEDNIRSGGAVAADYGAKGHVAETLSESGTTTGNGDMEQAQTSFVRPFVRSGGRTRAEVELPLEVLVSAVPSALGSDAGPAMADHRLVLGLCAQPRSIMEVAALAGMPLGVARVLVGDLAATGELTVHRTADGVGPGAALLHRVLSGLQEL